MRFEVLTYSEKIKVLKRLHGYINKNLFDNSLKEILLDIENLSKEEDLYGSFSFGSDLLPEKISISHELIDNVKRLKTQREQVLLLGAVVLHEAIHQYCFENGLDDEDHAGQWRETAEKHGLISIYESGKLIKETITRPTCFLLQMFRI